MFAQVFPHFGNGNLAILGVELDRIADKLGRVDRAGVPPATGKVLSQWGQVTIWLLLSMFLLDGPLLPHLLLQFLPTGRVEPQDRQLVQGREVGLQAAALGLLGSGSMPPSLVRLWKYNSWISRSVRLLIWAGVRWNVPRAVITRP